jgi:pilus assembly protein CpaF
VSGATGAGKTTVLNALAGLFPLTQRICTVEETAELQIDHPNVVRCAECRASDPPVTMRQLLRSVLRHRPDRILVGEVRGEEAWELLQILNTGHGGSICTIHANGAAEAFIRLGGLVLQANLEMRADQVMWLVSQVIHACLHIVRLPSGERLAWELRRVIGFQDGQIETEVAWRRKLTST